MYIDVMPLMRAREDVCGLETTKVTSNNYPRP